MRKIMSGLKVLEECKGAGPAARTGDTVVYDIRIHLNRGDEVPSGQPGQRTKLGKRHVIAGIENALIGMRAGGYLKVRVSPHLAYRNKGAEGVIPADAVLIISLWLREIE